LPQFLRFNLVGRFLCIEKLSASNLQLSSRGKRSDERFLSISLPVYLLSFTTKNSPFNPNSSLRLNRGLDTMALVYRHKPITRTDRNYSTLTNHQSTLTAPLDLIEFSIQWLWSIDTNPSLELTKTNHHSPLIASLDLIEFSIQRLWSIDTNPSLELTETTHHSRLTTLHSPKPITLLHHSRSPVHQNPLLELTDNPKASG